MVRANPGLSWVTSHTCRKTVATRLDEAGLSAREIADRRGKRRQPDRGGRPQPPSGAMA